MEWCNLLGRLATDVGLESQQTAKPILLIDDVAIAEAFTGTNMLHGIESTAAVQVLPATPGPCIEFCDV